MEIITVYGNIGKDAIFHQDKNYAESTLAVSRYKKGEQSTAWYKLLFFDGNVQGAINRLKKGTRVMLSGRFESDAYLDKAGQPQVGLKIVVDSFGVLSRPDESKVYEDSYSQKETTNTPATATPVSTKTATPANKETVPAEDDLPF